MALTSKQLDLVIEALCNAFPTREHLEMMLRIEMDVFLDRVVEAPDHTLRVYKLITWAESTGNMRAVLNAAASRNPGNPLIKRLVEESHDWLLDAEVSTISSPAPEPTRHQRNALDDAHSRYLDHLCTRYRMMDFKGMGMSDRVPIQLTVEQMYVPLRARTGLPDAETWARDTLLNDSSEDRSAQKVTEDGLSGVLSELVQGNEDLWRVLSTGYSAGKTQPVTEWLARLKPALVLDILRENQGLVLLGDPGSGKTTLLKYLTTALAQGQGESLGLGDRLPVLIPLSAYANSLAREDVALIDFATDYLYTRGIDVPAGQVIKDSLESGKALVMLDGLDEVQMLTQRALVIERVETFFDYQRKKGNKFIITSRIVGYRDMRLSADGLQEYTLVDFDDDDIVLFLTNWTQAIEQVAKGRSVYIQLEAAEEKAELLFALERNPRVRQLAGNPLLLTILALMKRQGVLLPERRVQLYEQYIQTLLRHWNLARGLDKRSARDLDVVETTRVLAPLALWLQETSPGVGLVKRGAIERRLEAIYHGRMATDPVQSAQQLLGDVRNHAGLLLERGPNEYGFIHLTFQEYLAAIAVAQVGQSDLSPVVELLAQRMADPLWHEVVLLTIGYMSVVQQRDEAASDVLLRLIERNSGNPGASIVLAGEAVLDSEPSGVTPRCRTVVKAALLATMLDSKGVAPALRARAGSILGALGDPRSLDELVLVPGGVFLMGGRYYNAEPQHEVHVATFRISEYPITNQQYAEFLAVTGYESPEHWRGKTPPRELNNHPVVNVSWHDAVAYCKWLSAARGEVVRLPTEAEWEKAARGKQGRNYPWGAKASANRANYGDTGIDGTSPVGCFPNGKSPYGCSDMAGNIDEWTSSVEMPYPYDPNDGRENPQNYNPIVVRGGSWVNTSNDVQCVSRASLEPNDEFGNVGFRIVCPCA